MASLIDSEYIPSSFAAKSAGALQNIESGEQDVINHLRTAGLRRDSEIKLVDDILRIRKERRQVFSAMHAKLKKMNDKISELEEESRTRHKQLSTERDEFVSREKELKQSYHARLKDQEGYLKGKLEEKLRQLNSKYEGYLERKEKEHAKAVEEARRQSTSREVQEVTKRADNENLRLVKSLRETHGQNEALKQDARQKSDAAEQLRKECIATHSRLEEERQRRLVTEKKLVEARRTIEALHAKLEREVKYARGLSDALDKQQEERSLATESLDREHAENMSSLERKVKQALAAKDDKIRTLTGQCDALTSELEGLRSFVD